MLTIPFSWCFWLVTDALSPSNKKKKTFHLISNKINKMSHDILLYIVSLFRTFWIVIMPLPSLACFRKTSANSKGDTPLTMLSRPTKSESLATYPEYFFEQAKHCIGSFLLSTEKTSVLAILFSSASRWFQGRSLAVLCS